MRSDKKLILFCASVAFARPISVLADEAIDLQPQLYGKLNLSLEREKANPSPGADEKAWYLRSNASRVGIRGESAVNDGLTVIYKLEWGISGDGDDADFTARDHYLGLSGHYGTVLFGKKETPAKLSQDKIDLFNDLAGDIGATFEGENRINDLLTYTTPAMGGVTASVAFAPAESESGGDNKAGNADDNGLADGVSFSLAYENNNRYLALAADSDIDGQDLLRLVGRLTFAVGEGNLAVGALLQQNETAGSADTIDEHGAFVSAAYTVGDTVYKLQLGQVDNDATLAATIREHSGSVGFDHHLGANTKWFAFLTRNQDEAPGDIEVRETIVALGLEHAF